MIVVYLEGEDPIRSNCLFAESDRPFDQWFKQRCKDIFPAEIDFNQPVPSNEEIFAATRPGAVPQRS